MTLDMQDSYPYLYTHPCGAALVATRTNESDTIGCCINFCVECVIPQETVKVFPGNKPWIAKAVGDVVNKKRRVFGQGDKMNLKRVQKELKRVIKIEKEKYKTKIEHKFTRGNMREVWSGMRLMGGYSESSGSGDCLPDAGLEYAGKLNEFCSRFGKHDFGEEVCDLRTTLEVRIGSGGESVLQVSEHGVCGEFLGLGSAKSAGPDDVAPRLLGLCAGQLAKVFAIIFNLSFGTQLVPDIWKRSCMVPVPKGPVISCMDDLGPVALTSVPVRVCERLFGGWLSAFVEDCIGPFRFACRSGRGCADAVLVMLEKLYHHAGRAGEGDSVGMMFFDFSSAFDTIRPHLLVQKLLNHNIPGSILAWILNYLTDRSQYVRITSKRTLSHCLQSNTGAPRGAVLAPFLFALYTSDCGSGEPSCPLVEFADDAAVIGLVGDDDGAVYRQQLAMFVNHCDANFLELGVSKTRGVIVDFRVSCSPPGSVVLGGGGVGRVSSCRYLGIMVDDGLAWHDHIDYLIKRLNVRMYCFRKLNYFHVDKRILALFYESVIASVWRYCLLCWGGNVSQGGRDKINRIVNQAGGMIAEPRQNLEDACADLLVAELTGVVDDAGHPLRDRLAGRLVSRSGRVRLPSAVAGRYLSSFVPQAIRIHNANFQRGTISIDM